MTPPDHHPEPDAPARPIAHTRALRAIDGPAKWAAVVVLTLAGAAIAGWALANPRPALHLTRESPTPTPTPAPAPTPTPEPESPAPVAKPARPTTAAATGVNINTATQAELELLPGVGPSLAQRIIADREKNGRYTTIDQLDRVKGIGPKTIEKLRPLIRTE